MDYTERHKELTTFFRQMGEEGFVPGTSVRVLKVPFHSQGGYNYNPSVRIPEEFTGFFKSESMAEVNDNFTYYLFLPKDGSAGKGAIILLHGLNERSWEKYLTWALRLVQDTGRAVVLFPIAYHMNRSPVSWIDRHVLMPAVAARILKDPGIRMASFANVALSTRISLSPHRFFLSGFQAVNDLVKLISQIKSGDHPFITSGRVDLFAYSIGVMITQAILLSGEGGLPADSRLFFFCGGSMLNHMDGTSKLIMDSRAFERLLSFYIDEIDSAGGENDKIFSDVVHNTPVGLAYYGMSSAERLRRVFGDVFRHEGDRIRTVTFSNDKVIPSAWVADAMHGSDVEIWSPEYDYIHENPFPVMKGDDMYQVDATFDRLFSSAARFFA
jgi:hypothetical protein